MIDALKRHTRKLLCLGFAYALAGCAAAPPAHVAATPVDPPTLANRPSASPQIVQTGPSVTGTASWYQSGKDLQTTASGQKLNDNALTAASPVLPLGTKVRVKPVHGGKSVVVLVNDRMPPTHRVLDLSEAAAKKLGVKNSGVAKVTVTPVATASAP